MDQALFFLGRPPYGVRMQDGVAQVALLVDFENLASPLDKSSPVSALPAVLTDIAQRFGRATVKRAYANWTGGAFARYQRELLRCGVELVQVIRSGAGLKNAADIRLAVDAMELLFTRPALDVFVLASGDGDCYPLAMRLREHGKQVVGVGHEGRTASLALTSYTEFVLLPPIESKAQGGWNRRSADTMASPHFAEAATSTGRVEMPVLIDSRAVQVSMAPPDTTRSNWEAGLESLPHDAKDPSPSIDRTAARERFATALEETLIAFAELGRRKVPGGALKHELVSADRTV